jgi:AcrR family transcriptional regulator
MPRTTLKRVASLLGRVREAAERYHGAEQELAETKEQLRAAMAAASAEGVPTARIAREAGVSRPTAHEWLKQR